MHTVQRSTHPADTPLAAKAMPNRHRVIRALITAYRVVKADPLRQSPEWYAGAVFMADAIAYSLEYQAKAGVR